MFIFFTEEISPACDLTLPCAYAAESADAAISGAFCAPPPYLVTYAATAIFLPVSESDAPNFAAVPITAVYCIAATIKNRNKGITNAASTVKEALSGAKRDIPVFRFRSFGLGGESFSFLRR